jgi:hypothetical protein
VRGYWHRYFTGAKMTANPPPGARWTLSLPLYTKGAVYFAFLFAADNPQMRYDLQNGFVDPTRDLLPGAARGLSDRRFNSYFLTGPKWGRNSLLPS